MVVVRGEVVVTVGYGVVVVVIERVVNPVVIVLVVAMGYVAGGSCGSVGWLVVVVRGVTQVVGMVGGDVVAACEKMSVGPCWGLG